MNVIFSLGTGTGTENSEITISNNTIYDFLNRGIASNGIKLSSNTTAWTINGNSFYETASFAPTAAVTYYVININNSAGQNFTVSNNFIGGNTALCGGTWTKTNAFANTFYGINLSVGSTIASNVQGNILKNMAYANGNGTGSWYGVYAYGGIINVGTTAGNTIGATTGNGSITYTSDYSGSTLYGIYIGSTVIVQNNNIGSITVANTNSTNATNFYGIYLLGSYAINIKNNVIGSTDAGTTNSINASSASTTSAQAVYGIYSIAGSTVTITGNTIAKMTNGTTNAVLTTFGLINGIFIGNNGSSNVITNNVVRDLTIANANNAQTVQASVGGIVLTNTTSGKVQNITGNTIYNLSNNFETVATHFTGAVCGINYKIGRAHV